MNSDRSKFLVVEFKKLGPEGVATHDQYLSRYWVCSAQIPMGFEAASYALDVAINQCGSRLSKNESEVNQSWSAPLPEQLWETLESCGMISGLAGIAVLEVVLHTKNGPVFLTRPRRFLVVQRGMTNAIYSCDNVIEAFSVAEDLNQGKAVPRQNVDSISRPKTRQLKK
ncbi:hypothetical protein [Luteimonas sp. TWI1416]|uniref:hypothetical protein n=1 Tax=unclassified Luteimonas TaxID=2629088 RepID=UPI00320B7BBC